MSEQAKIYVAGHRGMVGSASCWPLHTVRRCDTILELEHGRVVEQDTYEQLF